MDLNFEKKPVRSQFVTSHCECVSLKFEILKVQNDKCVRNLESIGISVQIGDILVLLYLGEKNGYFTFRSVFSAFEFLRLNGYV